MSKFIFVGNTVIQLVGDTVHNKIGDTTRSNNTLQQGPYLHQAYFTHSEALAQLESYKYHKAYRTCLQVCIAHWVIDNQPALELATVVAWLGVNLEKTFQNISLKLNRATLCMQWLQGQDKLDRVGGCIMKILHILMKRPLSPLSLSPNPENMEEMEENVLFAALKQSASGLDYIITEIKCHMQSVVH